MARSDFITNGTAEGTIPAYTIVKYGATDGGWVAAAAATDLLMGVNDSVPAASGERVDIVRAGIADVLYGATVTRGQPLTADASGRAVPAASTNRVIGFAEVSGVVGDVGSMLLAPGVF
ncbi:MAG: DUF2190 family protein [Proteobacteria bacterium]|nr:DUF2190 family protein [Pseudomonadota bacterium]